MPTHYTWRLKQSALYLRAQQMQHAWYTYIYFPCVWSNNRRKTHNNNYNKCNVFRQSTMTGLQLQQYLFRYDWNARHCNWMVWEGFRVCIYGRLFYLLSILNSLRLILILFHSHTFNVIYTHSLSLWSLYTHTHIHSSMERCTFSMSLRYSLFALVLFSLPLPIGPFYFLVSVQ